MQPWASAVRSCTQSGASLAGLSGLRRLELEEARIVNEQGRPGLLSFLASLTQLSHLSLVESVYGGLPEEILITALQDLKVREAGILPCQPSAAPLGALLARAGAHATEA